MLKWLLVLQIQAWCWTPQEFQDTAIFLGNNPQPYIVQSMLTYSAPPSAYPCLDVPCGTVTSLTVGPGPATQIVVFPYSCHIANDYYARILVFAFYDGWATPFFKLLTLRKVYWNKPVGMPWPMAMDLSLAYLTVE